MFRVTVPLLSRQWTPKQLRFFKKQRQQSELIRARKQANRPKYMPSWTRHDIWQEEPNKRSKKLSTTGQTTPSAGQPTPPTPQPAQATLKASPQPTTTQNTPHTKKEEPEPTTTQSTPPTSEQKEKKGLFSKFWK